MTQGARPLPGTTSEFPVALVVEDDVDAAQIAASMLRLCGFHVRTMATAHEALTVLTTERVGFVLLDICLPDMDGLGFLQVASRLPGFRGVPVVAASAIHPSDGAIGARLRALGVKHFLDKPFTMVSLRALLERMFPDRSLGPTAATTTGETEALALPCTISIGTDTREARIAAADARTLVLRGQRLPVGQPATVRLTHKQLVFDELTAIDLVAIGTVTASSDDAGGPIAHLDVLVARPPLEWDRMVAELPTPR